MQKALHQKKSKNWEGNPADKTHNRIEHQPFAADVKYHRGCISGKSCSDMVDQHGDYCYYFQSAAAQAVVFFWYQINIVHMKISVRAFLCGECHGNGKNRREDFPFYGSRRKRSVLFRQRAICQSPTFPDRAVCGILSPLPRC